MTVRIHPTADVSPRAQIGAGISIWHHAQVREDASIGANCIIGKGVYIDAGVSIGNNVKIQNNATIICGTTIGAWAMIGSGSVVTRDVPDYGLAWGIPARLHGFVCRAEKSWLWRPDRKKRFSPGARNAAKVFRYLWKIGRKPDDQHCQTTHR